MHKKPKAFLFDLNGTMIDDMGFHLEVWNRILNDDLKAGLTRDEVKQQLFGKNNELLDRVFGKGAFNEEQVKEISKKKEELYQELYRPELHLIPGLENLLEKAFREGISMAIGSAALPFNIGFVIDNLLIRHYFRTIVSADDVAESKPNPEVFLKAARKLGVPPEDCVVFEDVPKGAEAALNAGMKVIIVTTTHTQEEFEKYPNVLFCISDYTDPQLADLF